MGYPGGVAADLQEGPCPQAGAEVQNRPLLLFQPPHGAAQPEALRFGAALQDPPTASPAAAPTGGTRGRHPGGQPGIGGGDGGTHQSSGGAGRTAPPPRVPALQRVAVPALLSLWEGVGLGTALCPPRCHPHHLRVTPLSPPTMPCAPRSPLPPNATQCPPVSPAPTSHCSPVPPVSPMPPLPLSVPSAHLPLLPTVTQCHPVPPSVPSTHLPLLPSAPPAPLPPPQTHRQLQSVQAVVGTAVPRPRMADDVKHGAVTQRQGTAELQRAVADGTGTLIDHLGAAGGGTARGGIRGVGTSRPWGGEWGTPRAGDGGTLKTGDMGTLRDGDMGTPRVHGDAYGIGDPWGWGHEGLGTWGPLGLGTWTPLGLGTWGPLGHGGPQGWGHGDTTGIGDRGSLRVGDVGSTGTWDIGTLRMGTWGPLGLGTRGHHWDWAHGVL